MPVRRIRCLWPLLVAFGGLAWTQSSWDLWGWLIPSWGFLGPPGALLELFPPVASQIQGQARDEIINDENIKTDNRGEINNQIRQSKTKIQGRPWTSWGGLYTSDVSFDLLG